MPKRWLQIKPMHERALSMTASAFDLMFPSPVLVAAIVKSGKLIRTRKGNATHGYVEPVEPGGQEKNFTPSLTFMPIHMPPGDTQAPWVSIGRTTASDVVINDYTVSKAHGRLQLMPGRYQLEDSRSRNGTWIDEEQLRPFTPVPLLCGQQVRFGRQAFTFFGVAGFRTFLVDLVDESNS